MITLLLTFLLVGSPAFATLCADQIAPNQPHAEPTWRIQNNDPDFARIARLLPTADEAVVRDHLDFVVRAFEARARGEALSGWTDPMLRTEAERLLVHLRTVAAAWRRDNPALPGDSRRVYSERAISAHTTYRLLAMNLGHRLGSGQSIAWGALFRMTWIAALLEDEARHGYKASYNGPAPSLAEDFGIRVESEHAAFRAIATAPDEPAPLRTLEALVEEADRTFAQRGTVSVPVARAPTHAEKLALGFLPLQWAPVVPSEMSPPHDHYLEVSLTDFGYDSPLLRSKSPLDWTLAINESWRAWFAMLGGRDTDATSPRLEAAARIILYALRFGAVDAIAPDWSAGGGLLRFLINDVLFSEGATKINQRVLDHLWNSQPHLRPLYANFNRSFLFDEEITRGLDLIVVRLLPDMAMLLRDEGLRRLLARHPRDIVSTKFLVSNGLPKR